MEGYNHKEIEKKWQEKWEADNLYKTEDQAKTADGSPKENFYTLVEFPYPSGNLHVGHWYAFAVPDIFARFRRMRGYNVLYPIGFDSFGLPAENAAIKRGLDPKEWTYSNIDYMSGQLKSMGNMFDWSRKVVTSDPEYYKWTQWLFIELFKKGLVYKKKGLVNWCPSCQTVLANEQVLTHSTDSEQVATCERCGTEVTKKDLEQWYFKITDYAERLLKDLDGLDWPEPIKESQRNWIGKSEGAEFSFQLSGVSFQENQSSALSYVMGVDDITSDLKKIGVEIFEKTPSGDYKVTVPKNKLRDFEGLISEKLKPGFWNEYIADETVFIFKDQTGEIKRFIWDEANEAELLQLCNEYAKANFSSIRGMLEGNEWYREKLEAHSRQLEAVRVFTTRADTLFGVTYIVLAPEHELVQSLVNSQKPIVENAEEVKKYVEEAKKKTEIERTDAKKEKTGVELQGIKAIHPATGEEVPVWVADYVLAQYGTGAVMAVPAHDERDFQFAKTYNLAITDVIADREEGRALTEYGTVINSHEFDGLTSEEAKEKITEKYGTKKITYKLRDWLLSRQRYWGCPIPIVYDPEGKPHPVPEEHLPWVLPTDNIDYTPKGTSPLGSSKELVERTEKIFGKGWRPEIDTMDTFVDSSWYFLRYTDPHNDQSFADKNMQKSWMPVKRYSGGAEHTTMHLLYSRFFHKALYDLGLVNESEPFKNRMNRGLILGPDGQKMSKSKGNVVDPGPHVERVGADTVKTYLAFIGPYNEVGQYPWDLGGIAGVRRFLERVWKLQEIVTTDEDSKEIHILLNQTIKKVTEDIESYKFNTGISQMMILVNEVEKVKKISKHTYKTLLQLLAPFAPHLTEELWEKMGHKNSIHIESWPQYDSSKLIGDEVTYAIQINGKLRGELRVARDTEESDVVTMAQDIQGIKERIRDKQVLKTVFVKGRLVNFVIEI